MLVKDYSNNEALFQGAGLSRSWDGVYIVSGIPLVEPGISVRNVFVDTTPGSTARLYINFREQVVLPTIRQLYGTLRVSEEEVVTLLKQYIETDEVIDAIRRLKFIDLGKLASLVIWLTSILGLRVTSIDLVEDLETGQPQFIGIYIEECGWDEWKILSKTVKKQLVSEGFDDVAGRVALVCKQALRTRRS